MLSGGGLKNSGAKGAYLEVLADTLGSVGVIVGAVVIAVTWSTPDRYHEVGQLVGVTITPIP